MDLKLCMYNHLDTLESIKKLRGISDIFDAFMTSLVSDFSVLLQSFLTASVLKCVGTFDFHKEYVF